MTARPTSGVARGLVLTLLKLAASALATIVAPSAHADEKWCRDDLVTLQQDVCYAPGPAPAPGKMRTLVIFLHGLTDEGSGWQLTMQEGMARAGKALHFSVLAPRGRNGLGPGRKPGVIAWPTSEDGRAAAEDEIWARIRRARAEAEAKEGAPFENVFVVGFSNGAYYAASLALRGKLDDVDGYAVIAGGSAATPAMAKGDARKPVFVGVAAQDTTAKKGRELGKILTRLRWPHRTAEAKVGHVVSDDHLSQAMKYLRARAAGQVDEAAAGPAAERDRDDALPRKSSKPAKKKASRTAQRAAERRTR